MPPRLAHVLRDLLPAGARAPVRCVDPCVRCGCTAPAAADDGVVPQHLTIAVSPGFIPGDLCCEVRERCWPPSSLRLQWSTPAEAASCSWSHPNRHPANMARSAAAPIPKDALKAR